LLARQVNVAIRAPLRGRKTQVGAISLPAALLRLPPSNFRQFSPQAVPQRVLWTQLFKQ
jgi:hypothetical protein